MLKPLSVFLSACLLCGLPAAASGLAATQSMERVVQMEYEDGSTEFEFVPADTAKPGEELVYLVNYRNEGDEPEGDVVMTLPVPDDMVYVEDSILTEAEAAKVDFSVDGGKSFAPRDDLIVAEGEDVREAGARDITHVRWTLRRAVAPGEGGTLAFRATLY